MCWKLFFLSDNQRAWKCLEAKMLLYSSQLACPAPDYASPSTQDRVATANNYMQGVR